MSKAPTLQETTCYHCGEPCLTGEIEVHDKSFCCEGCKNVYTLLNSNDLCSYYELDENPGRTIAVGLERKRFDYLTDQDVQHKLIDFKSEKTASVTFFIPNIHCTSCVWLLENLQKLDEGILQGTVNFLKRTLTLLYNPSATDLRNIVELLTTIGYEPDLKLDKLNSAKPSSIQRGLWLKLGVAGFSFGNIMLFSFPEYLNMSEADSVETFKIFFGALNIALALPVLIYSSSDYLKSAWAAISQKGINLDVPITIGILALFGRSLYEILSGTGAGYFDSFTGFIFFLLIGKVVQKKTFDRLSFDRDYKSYIPISVMRLINGKEESVPVSKLEIGDRIIIRNQELIPVDSVLESEAALIDYSFITGESAPIKTTKGSPVFAGGKIAGQYAEMLVTKKVEQSYLTSLWENESFSDIHIEKKVTGFADRISPYFTYTVLVIAVLSCIIWLQIDPSKAFTIFTAVLIVACPCALALSTPFTLGSSVNILSMNGLYIRNTDIVEGLSKVDTVVFDKTGTITESEQALLRFKGKDLSKDELDLVKSVCRASIHPLSKKIFSHLESHQLVELTSYEEIPGKGITARRNGQTLVLGSRGFVIEQSLFEPESLPKKGGIGSQVHIVINNEYKGFFEFQNQPREGIADLIHRFKKMYRTYLLSGDNEKEGQKFAGLFGGWTNMYFDQSPQQKLSFIENLTEQGNHVVMVGDGLNDAGALQKSNFGIALSDDMSSFSPACDAILDGDELKNLDQFIQFGKISMNIILASFGLSLMYNLTGLGFAVTGHLSPLVAAIIMPLSSISVMVFTSVTTRLKAKKMGLRIWV